MKSSATEIRNFVKASLLDPARKRGEATVTVVCRTVLAELGYDASRAPAVCSALKKKEFLVENRLALESVEGPPKMQSVSVKFTFRLLDAPANSGTAAFKRLRGVAKDTFASLGGGEVFLRKERDQFYGPNGEK